MCITITIWGHNQRYSEPLTFISQSCKVSGRVSVSPFPCSTWSRVKLSLGSQNSQAHSDPITSRVVLNCHKGQKIISRILTFITTISRSSRVTDIFFFFAEGVDV